jgi:large subunit ribosomal protein L24
MKKEFSVSWKGSSKARKQRKYRFNAPRNIRGKMLAAHLSKDLRTKYTRRSFALRKGDTVKVMNGENKGKIGKIDLVDVTRQKVTVEGIQITKKDGAKVSLYLDPSNLLITELNMEDKKRLESIKKEAKKEIKEKK